VALQAIWLAGLVLAGRVLWRLAYRRLTVQGADGTLRMYFKLLGISFPLADAVPRGFLYRDGERVDLNASAWPPLGVLNQFHSLAAGRSGRLCSSTVYGCWATACSACCFWHMEDLEYYLTQGTFDMFLVRPISPFLQFMGREINYPGVADVVVGVAGMW